MEYIEELTLQKDTSDRKLKYIWTKQVVQFTLSYIFTV